MNLVVREASVVLQVTDVHTWYEEMMSMKRYGLALAVSLLVVLSCGAVFAQRGGGPPFVMGVVQVAGDNGAMIAVKPTMPWGGAPQDALITIKSDANTKFYEAIDIDVAQVKVGDVINVSGMPAKLQANTLQLGEDIRQLMGRAMGGGPGGPGGQGGQAGPMQPQAFASVSGPVVAVQPLKVDINGLVVEIETTDKTQLVKTQPLADATAIKTNAKVIAFGQRQDNNVEARFVLLDSTANGAPLMGGMGRGFGGGRRGGGPGPGAPAGGAPPAPAAPLPAPAPAK